MKHSEKKMNNTYKEKETALKVADLKNLAAEGCEFKVVNNPIKDDSWIEAWNSWIEAWKNGRFVGASKTLKNAYKVYDNLKKSN